MIPFISNMVFFYRFISAKGKNITIDNRPFTNQSIKTPGNPEIF